MLLRDTLLLVDPSPSSRSALRKLFESRFNILEASTTSQAELLYRHNYDYIAATLLDVNMILPSGISDFRELAATRNASMIPLIAIVDANDVQGEHRAFLLGAVDVIFRPYHSITAEHRVNNLIDLYRSRWTLTELVEEQSTTLRHTNEMMVDALSSIIECRSVESGQHVLRIRRFTQILLEEVARCCPEYELTEGSIQSISSAAALHDIGKIAIPDAILNKPAPLTAEEFEVMKTHTTSGSDILARLGEMGDEEYLRYAYNICRYHHERWTGKGYPEGLSGNDIPICAQVVGLADAYDALTTERVYKNCFSCSEAANMILNGDCGEFSPQLLECFKHVRNEFAELTAAYADGQPPRSDSISAPLSPPLSGAANSLQTLLTKHSALIHYLDATVMEVDLDGGVYHLSYNPDPDFNLIAGGSTLADALTLWSKNMCAADGSPLPPSLLRQSLETFHASGARQKSFLNLLKGMDGRMHQYKITLLRLDTDSGTRKAMLIWQKMDTNTPPLSDGEVHLKRALTGLLGLSQPLLYDQWLTMPRISPSLLSLLGYSEEEISARFQNRLLLLVPENERTSLQQALHQQLSHSCICEVEIPLQHKNGSTLWLINKGILAADSLGNEHIYGILVDVTQTRQAQEKLRLTLDQQQLIFDQSSDIIFELDFITDRLTCSPKWESRFGYSPIREHISTELPKASHFHPDDVSIFQEKMALLQEGASFTEFTVRISDATGHYLWSRVRASLQRDESGRPARAVGVFIDIDDELRASWALMANANRDSLTKLLNRDACRREVKSILSAEDHPPLSALAILDLDNFKEVNDHFGHLYGDTVLTRVSAEISGMFRGTDVVGRIGGDEFIIFMPDIPNQKLAQERFQILIDSLNSLLQELCSLPSLSCSVGVAFSPDHGTAYEELFQRADRALYQAKSLGKNQCCCYTPAYQSNLFPTMVSHRIDSDTQPGIGGNSLIQFFFERLYESGDMEGTIQSLLEIVGTEMNVSRVYIFENNGDNTTCSNTFEWCNEGISPEIQNLQNVSYITDIPGFQNQFNERGIFYCPDVSQLSQDLRDILEPQGIKSLLHCAIRDQGVFRGYVGFDENKKARLWTQEQIDLLTFLSQLLSVFLLKQRAREQSELMVKDLRSVLDNQYAWTYVVDPDDYTIQFLNGKTLDIAPDAREGSYCYQTLMGKNAPCDSCPTRLSDGCGGSCILNNTYLGLRVRASAHTIHWNGKPCWLVTCQETDTET